MALSNFSNNSNYLVLFNFSIDKAVLELEFHVSKDWIFEKSTEKIIIIFYILLIIFGVISNLIMTGIIIKTSRISTFRYPYVMNLSIADLILCLFCMPFTMITVLKRSWNLGSLLCKLMPFIQGSTVYISSATVSFIAIDRHKKVLNKSPKLSKKKQSYKLKSILAIWLGSFILSSPVSIAQTVITVSLPGIYIYEKCVEKWPWVYAKGIYTILTLIFQFIIPSTILLVSHFRIEAYLNFRVKRQVGDIFGLRESRARRELRRNRHVTMVLFLISIVFSLTWMPWNILNLTVDFWPEPISTQNLYLTFTICHMIAMTSAISNPILYGWFNVHIRKEFLSIGEKINTNIFYRLRSHDCEIISTTCEKSSQKYITENFERIKHICDNKY